MFSFNQSQLQNSHAPINKDKCVLYYRASTVTDDLQFTIGGKINGDCDQITDGHHPSISAIN
jgi:hypothetical protein